MVLIRRFRLVVLLVIVIALGACSPEGLGVLNLPDADHQGPTPTPLPSPAPTRVLSICLGDEPRSLFFYGDQSPSARIIRQAIYDGPVDRIGYQSFPVILDAVPNQENGLVVVKSREVFPGDRIVDTQGNPTRLGIGVEFRPAGCLEEDCWEVYQDQASVTMDQVEISYNLKDDLFWSDGSSVSPEDSLYSFQTAQLIYNSIPPNQLVFTASYELGEEQDLIWQGLPGYLGIYDYSDYFFFPLPKIHWESFTREELLTAPESNVRPLGWGAYQVLEWIPGDHITLLPNPFYWETSQGSPGFDALVFRFMDGAEEALAAYSAGECQIIANEPGLLSYQAELLSWQSAGDLRIYTADGGAWEQVSFGINSLHSGSRLLEDPALRRALAGCIDRESITGSRLDVGAVVDDYYFPNPSLSSGDEGGLSYQPAQSVLDLKELGWLDEDGDPETPRIARGVANVNNGTALELSLLAAAGDQRTITLDYIKEGLKACGVGLEVITLPASELLAPGPEGPVFGRDFELAYFSWRTGSYQPCKLFLSSEVPGVYPDYPKGWGGVNNPGFNNPDFDQACLTLLTTLPDSEEHWDAAEAASEIFRDQLPVIPLFFQRDLIIAQSHISGLESGFWPQFWSLEALE
jgi:peptide/nickel transport system substrate-binding protein